ncbi:hypothetical protein PV328_010329 [Microctonus aethiopoides]|uniref:Reverse transcriptase n=1 Tax=Microctonus aethiopoides TaxID=144406 RepID=A0AA39C7W7_9HYME|nr:hypothetical protein PV328_010329 [Microctonus aethiopoides]
MRRVAIVPPPNIAVSTFESFLTKLCNLSLRSQSGFSSERKFHRKIVTGLNVLYQWKYLDWIWPNVALTSKNFTYGNPFTQDVDVDFKSRIFVTTPQWLKGTPITLSTLTDVHGPGGPLLTPYPHWTWHTLYDCNKIISVYRIAKTITIRTWFGIYRDILKKVVSGTLVDTETCLEKWFPGDWWIPGLA